MRARHSVGLLTSSLVAVLGLPVVAAVAAPITLYVNSAGPAACSDAGQGSQAQPYCTIAAAAAVVQPGQTVEVANHADVGKVTLTRSGEEGRPVTFRGTSEPWTVADLDVVGGHDIVVRSFGDSVVLRVADSSRVTVDGVSGSTLKVTGASSDVTVSRSSFGLISAEAGSTGTVIARNGAYEVRATDAPGTTVTGNEIIGGCTAGISLAGNSPRSNVFNNVVRDHFSRSAPYNCGAAPEGAEIVVSAESAVGTRVGYNTYNPYRSNFTSGTAYSWAGKLYQDPATLSAATGGLAGGNDIVVPQWSEATGQGSAVTDSADATAPGFLPVEHPADDPDTANTGTGLGYYDRGTGERQEQITYAFLAADPLRAPTGTEVALRATTYPAAHWPTTQMSYRFDFGDGSPVLSTGSPTARHTYARACDCRAKVTADHGVNRPVTSTETRMDVTLPGPLKAAAVVRADVPTTNDFADTPALGVTVDPSATYSPWAVTKVVVDYGDGSVESGTGLDVRRHGYSSPGDYTVKVTVTDAAGGTDSLSAPFTAAYAPSGFLRTNPYRLLDTRQDPQVLLQGGRENTFTIPTGSAAGADAPPAGISSVVLNVTVTDASEDTHLTVWPAGQKRPQTSNVNIAAGRTSANLVTVPVGQAHGISTYLNAGRGELIVDVVGFYRPNGGFNFTPLTPARLLDTRSSVRLGAGEARPVKVVGVNGVPANAESVVLNLTSTETSTDTYVTVYPGGKERPVSSNLNPEPGKDKANQVIVPVGADGTVNVFNHDGATHVVLDVFGYYSPDSKGRFTPTVPVRLADTRSNPFAKPGPDSTTVVGGVPVGAVAAVLNVTTTDTSEDSYVTVHADGAPRPGTSNLNLLRGATIPNHVTTPVSQAGKVDIYNHTGSTNLLADLFGYFTNA